MINKKRTKIIVEVLALFLVMTVGYALFSDTLTINGTATAQGNFDLTYECLGVDEDGGTGTCTVDGNTITTTSTFNKPRSSVFYEVTVTNTGTIPVKLKTATSNNNYGFDENNNIFEGGDQFYLDKDTLLFCFYDTILTLDSGGASQVLGDTEMESSNIFIKPQETVTFEVIHQWADNEDLKEMGIDVPKQPALPEGGVTMTYNIKLGFEQITT